MLCCAALGVWAGEAVSACGPANPARQDTGAAIVIFKQFYEPSLGHASYLIGSEETGEALVLDVRRDVDGYYRFARNQGLRIAHAADTHQHNDYLTGITQLESRGPLELLSGARAELGYATRPLQDGERVTMGEVEVEVMHTPGHTPEHISLLVRDRDRGEEPLMLLSGGAAGKDPAPARSRAGLSDTCRRFAVWGEYRQHARHHCRLRTQAQRYVAAHRGCRGF
jgi:glyoxylase-like metal-dependent hydrolase (beta-lactamase superfamily II)